MSIYELVILLIGSGGLVTAVRVAYAQGAFRREFVDYRKQCQERIGTLERIVIYDRLPKLQDAGMVERNSPWSISDARQFLDRLGGTMPHFIRAFERVMAEPLPAEDGLLIGKLERAVGAAALDDRAQEWARVASEDRGERFTPADYLALWVVVLRQAERVGTDKMLRDLGVK